MRCDECLYWLGDRNDPEHPEGWCHRNPPTPNPISVATLSATGDDDTAEEDMDRPANWMWPATCGHDFCGEFRDHV